MLEPWVLLWFRSVCVPNHLTKCSLVWFVTELDEPMIPLNWERSWEGDFAVGEERGETYVDEVDSDTDKTGKNESTIDV